MYCRILYNIQYIHCNVPGAKKSATLEIMSSGYILNKKLNIYICISSNQGWIYGGGGVRRGCAEGVLFFMTKQKYQRQNEIQ